MINMTTNNERIEVTTRKVRLNFPHLFEPHSFDDKQDPKYSAVIMLPKTDTGTKKLIEEAIEKAIEKGVQEKWGGKRPKNIDMAFTDYDAQGLEPDDEGYYEPYKGHYIFNAKSNAQWPPVVVSLNPNIPITDQSEIYSGVYARVNLSFFPYSYGKKTGVGIALNMVQKLADGEPLSGRRDASDVFGNVEIDPITGEPILD